MLLSRVGDYNGKSMILHLTRVLFQKYALKVRLSSIYILKPQENDV